MQGAERKDHQFRKDSGKAAISGADRHIPAVSPGSSFGGERTEPSAASILHRPHSYNRRNQLHSSLGSPIPNLSRKPVARQNWELLVKEAQCGRHGKSLNLGPSLEPAILQYSNVMKSTCTSSEMPQSSLLYPHSAPPESHPTVAASASTGVERHALFAQDQFKHASLHHTFSSSLPAPRNHQEPIHHGSNRILLAYSSPKKGAPCLVLWVGEV